MMAWARRDVRSATAWGLATALAACAPELRAPPATPASQAVHLSRPALADEAEPTSCGPPIGLPTSTRGDCHRVVYSDEMTLTYGPGLTVTISPFHDIVTFEGTDVWATGKYRGLLSPGQICCGGRLVETFAAWNWLLLVPRGGPSVQVAVTKAETSSGPVFRPQQTEFCEPQRYYSNEFGGTIGGCKNRQRGRSINARLKRWVRIPVYPWMPLPASKSVQQTEVAETLFFDGGEVPYAYVSPPPVLRPMPFVQMDLALASPPYAVSGWIPASAVAEMVPPRYEGPPRIEGRPWSPVLDLEVTAEAREVLVCDSLAPSTRADGGDYGFHAGPFYAPLGNDPPYWPEPHLDRFRGGPSHLRFDYEVLGPSDGTWIPVRMAPLRDDRPRDEWAPWYAAELKFDHDLPLRIPVARLRQCRYWAAADGIALEPETRFVERPTLPDGTPVGVHAAPVPRACQNVRPWPDYGAAFLAAPAVPLPAE